MALYTININPATFNVQQIEFTSTECADIYQFEIFAENGDEIHISLNTDVLIDYFFYNGLVILSNGAINTHYINNGVRTDFIGSTTVIFNNSLTVGFAIENSGISGFFNNVDLEIENKTTGGSYNTYTTTLTRENDKSKCNSCCSGTNSNELGLYPPQLFNPNAGEVIAGTMDVTVLYINDVGLVSINGLILDDSEYSLVGTTLTITPDNGFDDIDDEILVFQNKQ